jgi:uncharacterized peroxidase-related enzyme
MSRIPAIEPTEATGRASELLAAVKGNLGLVPNMTKVMAAAPAVLEGYLGLSGALAGGTLPAKLREQLALTVGEANGCDYCLSAHSLFGTKLGLTEGQLFAAREGRSDDAKTGAALHFARQVLTARGKVTEADLTAVRAAGFTDTEVAEIVGHVALNTFTNYVNNVAETEIDFPKAAPLAR